MKNETATARDVLNFVVAKQGATEDAPVKIGNVEFWHPIGGFSAGLCYSIPTQQWDAKAVQDDLNRLAAPIWGELMQHLGL